ncbi:MAG TPA: hypothetical protein VNR60_11950 [Croceibacterium sp.]|nr:hypothetical protein [Croceibacterium sp.]
MKIYTITLIMLVLAGCGGLDDHLAECDDAIRASLDDPASYARVSVNGDYRPKFARYSVTFHGLSGSGERLRGEAVCAFDGGGAIITTNTAHSWD